MSEYTPPLPSTARPGEKTAPLSRGEQALKVLSASGDLQSIRRPTRIDGEISKISRDGTTATIETESGAIEVRLRGREGIQAGQKVQIDLPAGSPPRQIVMRITSEPAPAPTPQQPGNAPTPTTQPDRGNAPAPVPQTPQSPAPTAQPLPTALPQQQPAHAPLPPILREVLDAVLPPTSRPAPLAQAAPVQLPAPLLPDTLVRLVPLTAMPPQSTLMPLPVSVPASMPEHLTIAATTLPPGLTAPITAPPPAQPIQTAQPPAATALPGTQAPDPNTPVKILPGMAAPTGSNMALHPALNKITDFFARPVQSIMLPIMKQVQPFITPITTKGTETPATLPVIIGEAGKPLMMRVISITAENATPQGTPMTGKGGNEAASPSIITLHADVVATTKQHFPILSMQSPGRSTPESFLLQFAANNIPVGTQLELMPQPGQATGQAPTTPLPGAALPLATPIGTLLSGLSWPSFDEAYQILAPTMMGAGGAQAASGPILPNPATPQNMPPAMLFFMAAIGAGDLSGWLGEKAMNNLRREGAKGADIISRMNRDFAGLVRMSDEPVTQDWRGMAIPMLWQNEVAKINLFYRHNDPEKDEHDDKDGERNTRFLFDLELTQIGPMQLDGYMKSKRLDLIVRSQTPFSHVMQNEMRKLYLNVLEQGSLTGDLAFQHRADQWVKVDIRQSEIHTSV
jgi:hypothetical protein